MRGFKYRSVEDINDEPELTKICLKVSLARVFEVKKQKENPISQTPLIQFFKDDLLSIHEFTYTFTLTNLAE